MPRSMISNIRFESPRQSMVSATGHPLLDGGKELRQEDIGLLPARAARHQLEAGLGVVRQNPGVRQGTVDPHKVYQTARVTAPDRLLGDVVAAATHALGHALDGQVR